MSNTTRDRGFTVTAAICCYNAESFIQSAVLSLMNQTLQPDQIIVVDDGSTDKSIDEIKHLQSVGTGRDLSTGDQPVVPTIPLKVIKHETNKGLSAARNTVLKAAKGDIIAYIDSDTVADSKMIENMVEHYNSDEVYAVGGQGIEVNINNIYDKWRKYNAYQSLGDKVIEDAEMLPGLCCSYRKSALEKVGGFDEYFARNAEDHDISIRLRKAGGRLVYSPEIKVEHYRTDNLITLLKMIYRYDLWTIIAKKRNNVCTRKSMRIPIFRIGVFFKRILHILKGNAGIKFALIDFLIIFVSLLVLLKSLKK